VFVSGERAVPEVWGLRVLFLWVVQGKGEMGFFRFTAFKGQNDMG
jgi:hypothetical protein